MAGRIYRYEFNEILKKIPDISTEERAYLNQVFQKDLIDGLTEFDLRQKINSLSYNQEDQLDRWELESVKKKILERLA